MIGIAVLILLGAHLLILISILLSKTVSKDILTSESFTLSKVSVLVAARNESDNIGRCMEALVALNYPAGLIQVLIGDDDSSDNTGQIIEEYAAKYPQIRKINIRPGSGNLRAKANVLAQLADMASGDYIFITDADCAVGTEWIRTMLPRLQGKSIVLTGTTITADHSTFFTGWQCCDWLYLCRLLNFFSRNFGPVSAIGNNMSFRRADYEAIGGYANVPFSVTEDFALTKAFAAQGIPMEQLFRPEAVVISEPCLTMPEFLHQRRRWISGGWGMPWIIIGLMMIYTSFLPALVCLAFTQFGYLCLPVLLFKLILDLIILRQSSQKTDVPLPSSQYLYSLYSMWINFRLIVYSFTQRQVIWKGRKFS